MPGGAGIHPYFPRVANSRVVASATRMWRNDATGLAIAEVDDNRFVGERAVPIGALDGVDNCFASAGPVVVEGGGRSISVSGAPGRGFHLYVPTGADHFCVEPVSHFPDSFGRGEWSETDRVAPGATRRWRYRLAVSNT